MKKVISLLLIFAMLLSVIPVMAADLPSSFWPANERYTQALSSKDYSGIASSASQIINIVSALPKDSQTVDIIGSRAYEAAFAYYFLGDYDNAVKYFDIYIPYGVEKGWTDGVKIAREYIKQLTSQLEIYKYTPNEQVYYGAKNEPHGVLYGQVSEKMKSEESMVLLYLEYGDTYFDWANVVMDRARSEGKYVELALNFPEQGYTAKNISSSDWYLSELLSFLSSYPDVKVFLRIGAEMNIWGTPCTPEEFIAAYRTIAEYVRHLPNIACVWDVSHTSAWNVDMNEYYPGDDYVDWVGISTYSNKYFEGRNWSNEEKFNEVYFKAGYSSNPVGLIKDVVDTYGDRKPIMLAECGTAYRTNGSINEEHHEWAATQLRNMFSLIPMVYPQVKLMAYFNKNISYEMSYYDLDGSWALSDEYGEITKSDWFIHAGESSAGTYFEKVWEVISTNGSFTLGAYPRIFGADSIIVDYYIDGQHYKSANEAPYEASFENIAGEHTLHVVATGSTGTVLERDYIIRSEGYAEEVVIPGNTVTVNDGEFSDTSYMNDAQKEAISYVVDNGIVNGYEDNTFRPYNTITRAEFATVICRYMGYDVSENCSFDDAYDHWASAYIKACVDTGAINGTGNNLFAPEDEITFEQAVKIISIVCSIADANDEYPYGFINKAGTAGLFEGLSDGADVIEKPLSRVDAVMMLYNAA